MIIKSTEQLVELLLRQRKSLGITQEQLSKLSGISRIAIANIETRRTGIHSHTIFELLGALGLYMKVDKK